MIHYVRKLFDQIFYAVYIIRRCLTMEKLNHNAVTSLNEVSDSELDTILGGLSLIHISEPTRRS